MKNSATKGFIVVTGLGTIALAISAMLLMVPALRAQEAAPQEQQTATEQQEQTGKRVLVYLDTMRIELRDGETFVQSFPIVSKGKPGSYYETPGGTYINDYKVPLHFSSFGHVYLPYSVHIFGNFFIHGIPYYPNGERVSSSYSGGCIRVADDNMKEIYDFVSPGTVISIGMEHTKEISGDFVPKQYMTRLMVGIVSLEVLPQDGEIVFNGKQTKRLDLLGKLVSGDTGVATLYAKTLGEESFINLMNAKAKAIGLSETTFTSVVDAPTTSGKDMMLFHDYVSSYKSYLFSIGMTFVD